MGNLRSNKFIGSSYLLSLSSGRLQHRGLCDWVYTNCSTNIEKSCRLLRDGNDGTSDGGGQSLRRGDGLGRVDGSVCRGRGRNIRGHKWRARNERHINPGGGSEEVGQFELGSVGSRELSGKRCTTTNRRPGTRVLILTKQDVVSPRITASPIIPSSSVDARVEVGVNVSNASILVPGSTKVHVGERRTVCGRDLTLVKDEAGSSSAISSLVGSDRDLVLVGGNV